MLLLHPKRFRTMFLTREPKKTPICLENKSLMALIGYAFLPKTHFIIH